LVASLGHRAELAGTNFSRPGPGRLACRADARRRRAGGGDRPPGLGAGSILRMHSSVCMWRVIAARRGRDGIGEEMPSRLACGDDREGAGSAHTPALASLRYFASAPSERSLVVRCSRLVPGPRRARSEGESSSASLDSLV
jgi:hypothetical protein